MENNNVKARETPSVGLNSLCLMPDLSFMSTEDLVVMLRDCSKNPEDKWFTEGIIKELMSRKPSAQATSDVQTKDK